VRRIHLYAGLFLLPWVLLYGITGAMFNHQGLLPEATIYDVPSDALETTSLSGIPSPETLAQQVVDALKSASPEDNISLLDNHGAEFNNSIILEASASGRKHAVRIDPVKQSASVLLLPQNEQPELLIRDVRHVKLQEDPYEMARESVPEILRQVGIESDEPPKPRGWCKLNFLADVNGQPARITYVLRDGHVDVTRYGGDSQMSARRFFLRLHTSHGQPPHWNARMIWSVLLDAMAIAMVTWSITGLIMWWQLKRTRIIGGIVITASLLSAFLIYTGMIDFYATTKM